MSRNRGYADRKVETRELRQIFLIIREGEKTEPELEATGTLKPIKNQTASLEEEELRQLEWHEFIDKTYGCLADDPIIRHPQGEYEQREPIE
ncbi:MAG: hypothetical protein V7K88_09620 [Nostoc sp.]|uniref:hypothetical protein n=1 Tax=Nostoc sp. TaxID=1180 RepID=UPI002FF96C03